MSIVIMGGRQETEWVVVRGVPPDGGKGMEVQGRYGWFAVAIPDDWIKVKNRAHPAISRVMETPA